MVTAQFDIGPSQGGSYHGQQLFGHSLVNEEHIQGVADSGPLYLGVVDDGWHFLVVGAAVHVNVANADSPGDNGDRGILDGEAMQTRSAPGNDHVDVLVGGEQVLH